MFCIDITLIAYSRGRLDFDTNLGLMQCVDFLNNVKKTDGPTEVHKLMYPAEYMSMTKKDPKYKPHLKTIAAKEEFLTVRPQLRWFCMFVCFFLAEDEG